VYADVLCFTLYRGCDPSGRRTPDGMRVALAAHDRCCAQRLRSTALLVQAPVDGCVRASPLQGPLWMRAWRLKGLDFAGRWAGRPSRPICARDYFGAVLNPCCAVRPPPAVSSLLADSSALLLSGWTFLTRGGAVAGLPSRGLFQSGQPGLRGILPRVASPRNESLKFAAANHQLLVGASQSQSDRCSFARSPLSVSLGGLVGKTPSR